MGQNKNTPQCPDSSKEKRVFSNHLELINPFVAGIDIGSKSHFVAAPNAAGEICVREFSCFTSDLLDLVKWLKECKVTSTAMESTGVYWIPLHDLLILQPFIRQSEEKFFFVPKTPSRTGLAISIPKWNVFSFGYKTQKHNGICSILPP